MKRSALVCLLLWLCACDTLGGAGGRPEGTRRVTMTIPLELVQALGARATALQLAAVVVRPDGSFSLHTSTSVDPAAEDRLSAYWPVDESYVVVVQSPGAGGAGSPGALAARVSFGDGTGGSATRIPRGTEDLDLGTPAYSPGASGAPALLGVDDGHNPLAQVDSDADGTSDLADLDDDEDGTADSADADRDGDGVPDSEQELEALADADADGIPDLFE